MNATKELWSVLSHEDRDQMTSTYTGMATNKSLGDGTTKSTTGRPEVEVPILSVCVNDIKTVKYNIATVS